MFKTAIFKLHNPSKKKQALLNKAFRNYHLLYDRLLKAISKDPDSFYNHIRVGKGYSDRKAVQYINSRYKNIMNAFVLASGLKESLCKDLAGNLISYKELLEKGQKASFPKLQPLKSNGKDRVIENLYESLRTCTDIETYNSLRDEINRQSGEKLNIKPLLFIRCDTSHNNMSFLYNPDRKKYYALLNVLPSGTKNRLILSEKHGLYDVRTGELFTKPKGMSTALLFSIETGERIINRFLGKGEPKEGRLVYSNNEYFLHLAFDFEETERIPVETVMGIDRGIDAICAYSVLDPEENYNLLRNGIYEGKTLKELLRSEEKRISEIQRRGGTYRLRVRRNRANRIIHEATNMVANIALRYRSQVYVEDLESITDRSKPRRKNSYNRVLNRSQYQKFLKILDYKLKERGLPEAKKVHPAHTSTTCVECCSQKKENRPSQAVFKCVECGYEDNADKNASRVIALKGVWTYIKKDAKKQEDIDTFIKFLNKIKDKDCSLTLTG